MLFQFFYWQVWWLRCHSQDSDISAGVHVCLGVQQSCDKYPTLTFVVLANTLGQECFFWTNSHLSPGAQFNFYSKYQLCSASCSEVFAEASGGIKSCKSEKYQGLFLVSPVWTYWDTVQAPLTVSALFLPLALSRTGYVFISPPPWCVWRLLQVAAIFLRRKGSRERHARLMRREKESF